MNRPPDVCIDRGSSDNGEQAMAIHVMLFFAIDLSSRLECMQNKDRESAVNMFNEKHSLDLYSTSSRFAISKKETKKEEQKERHGGFIGGHTAVATAVRAAY